VKLRPYQEAALDGTRAALRAGAKSVVIQMPTGTGKSLAFLRMISGVVAKGKRAMLLVQGQTLVRQAAKHLSSIGVSVGIEMGDDRVGPRIGARGLIDDAPQIVVASRDSLARRLKHYPRDFFRMIVVDECFPAGTLVDGRPIETIEVGDLVRAYNPATRKIEMRPVVRLFKNPVRELVRLHLSDGSAIVCTPEHPFALGRTPFPGSQLGGYVPARSMLGERVVRVSVDAGAWAWNVADGPEVLRIEPADLASSCPDGHVYNFEVEDLHNYFVNDTLVHNCHHLLSNQYLDILEHFGVAVPRKTGKTKAVGDTVVVGLTATPDRGDGGDIMTLFDAVGFSYGIAAAIDDGWLVPIEQEFVTLPGLDLSKVRRTAGDLNARDLEAVIRPLLEPICKDIVRVADGRPTLIYNPLITMADATTSMLGKTKGAGAVKTITAETEGREALFKAMGRGEVWAFSSVGTLTEGVDIPCATIGAMLRLTTSRPLYAQIMGRLLRPSEDLAYALNDMGSAAERRAAIASSSKPRAWMLDFAGNSGKHKLIHVVDVIGEGEEDKVMSLAKGHMGRGVTDPLEAIAKAKAELAEMLARAAGGEVERILVDPFALFSVKAKKDTFERPVTEAQIDALLNAGAVEVKINSEKSREKAREAVRKRFDLLTASAMLDESSRRMRAGEASLRQVRRLVKAGLSPERARTISFQDARRAIDDLERQEWKTSPAWIAKHSGAQAPETRAL
jgi:superfamily II DNA or RNA helicase